jgi:nucleoside-diphosphate-sugar epimerase
LRTLLLGGTGFLGGHCTRALLEAGHEVTVLSRGSRGPATGAESLVADRRDERALATVLEGRRFDRTVDLAAYEGSDVERLLRVPEASLGRYTLISTGQVYLVTRCPRPPYREEDSRYTYDHANWQYGIGKRRAERTLLSLASTHGMRVVILRLPIVVGEEDASLRLWAYLERMLDRGPILLPDGGRRPVRFLDAADFARVVVRLVEGPMPPGNIYNLAQPEAVPLRAMLEQIAAVAGERPRFLEASWEDLEREGLERAFSPFAGPWASHLDPSRARAELGFAGTPVEEYLPRVTRWTLEHRPERSHPGYAQRSLELAIAGRLG